MARRPRPRTLLAAAAGLLLGACSGSLYDAGGVPPALDVGGSCDVDTQHVCPGPDTTCRNNLDPDYCSHDCLVCPAAPPGGERACVSGGPAGWTCGFTCTAPDRACPARNACLPVGPAACGDACVDCTLTAPPGSVATCSPAGQCGYACSEGRFPCKSGCCAPAALAAGGDTSCAITTNGAATAELGLACWGKNDAGQLGRGGSEPSSFTPAPVSGMDSGVQMVAVGGQHACAVKDGEVWCWGSDAFGQLGDGAPDSTRTPPVRTGLTGIVRLVAGRDHTCALKGGSVLCWGANNKGQLGTGSSSPPTVTAPPASGILTNVTLLAAGGDTTCAVAAGAVRCWGANTMGQAAPGNAAGFVATPTLITLPAAASGLAVGGGHACAVLAPGSGIWCWGANGNGQLGTGSTGAAPSPPVQAGKIDNGQDGIRVAAGSSHTCGSKDLTELICNGKNDQNQCGVAPASASVIDRIAVGLVGTLDYATGGGDHTCALLDEGLAGKFIRCWGRNAEGQLGRDTASAPSAAASKVPGPPP